MPLPPFRGRGLPSLRVDALHLANPVLQPDELLAYLAEERGLADVLLLEPPGAPGAGPAEAAAVEQVAGEALQQLAASAAEGGATAEAAAGGAAAAAPEAAAPADSAEVEASTAPPSIRCAATRFCGWVQ